MNDVRQTQRAEQDRVSGATEFEVRLRVNDARAHVPRRARVDRLDDEARAPSLAGALEHEKRRVDDFGANPVAGQTREFNVDHA